MLLIRNQKIIFVGGKGGVGKTTIASAMAAGWSRSGSKVLLISTDPAHNLGDLWKTRIGNQVKTLDDRLDALELDSHEEAIRYIEKVRSSLEQVVRPDLRGEIRRQMDLALHTPGTMEAALLDRLTEVLVESFSRYDRILIDTAPTGHTLHLLSLPESMTTVMNGLIEKQKKRMENSRLFREDRFDNQESENPADHILALLNRRKEKYSTVRDFLLDSGISSFLFVLQASELSIEETRRSIQMLKKFNLHTGGIVVNGILPEKTRDPFFQERIKAEQKHLARIRKAFRKLPAAYVSLQKGDVSDRDSLFAIAKELSLLDPGSNGVI